VDETLRTGQRHLDKSRRDELKGARWALLKSNPATVMAHWIHRTTNASLEGLNSVFSAVKRKARGFRSSENLIAMLYFTAARLALAAIH
jgi:transposase